MNVKQQTAVQYRYEIRRAGVLVGYCYAYLRNGVPAPMTIPEMLDLTGNVLPPDDYDLVPIDGTERMVVLPTSKQ